VVTVLHVEPFFFFLSNKTRFVFHIKWGRLWADRDRNEVRLIAFNLGPCNAKFHLNPLNISGDGTVDSWTEFALSGLFINLVERTKLKH
jgi:hypothetical protein